MNFARYRVRQSFLWSGDREMISIYKMKIYARRYNKYDNYLGKGE